MYQICYVVGESGYDYPDEVVMIKGKDSRQQQEQQQQQQRQQRPRH